MMDAVDVGRFYGIRHEPFFFSPFASTSSITITTKQLFYFMISGGILALIGFERIDPVAGFLVIPLIFMAFYKHRGVNMEYVFSYMFKTKGKKKKTKTKKEEKSSSLFSASSMGRGKMEMLKGTEKEEVSKEPKLIKMRPDDVFKIVLDVGLIHRLKKVDVEIDGQLINCDNTESNGTIRIMLNGNFENGLREITVRESGNRKVIAKEKVRIETV